LPSLTGWRDLWKAEAERFLWTMSFANVQDLQGYIRLLSRNGCEVRVAEDTGRFPSHFDLSLKMIEMQLTYDVLATVGFRADLLETSKTLSAFSDSCRAQAR
jgi:hypothetical protein